MIDRTKNARFWIRWAGSPVKLTLRPGQELRATEPAAKGWCLRVHRWFNYGDHVIEDIKAVAGDPEPSFWDCPWTAAAGSDAGAFNPTWEV